MQTYLYQNQTASYATPCHIWPYSGLMLWALAFSSYAIRRLWNDNGGREVNDWLALSWAMACATPVSASFSGVGAFIWRDAIGEDIGDSNAGLATISMLCTFPVALVCFFYLDSWRLFEESMTLTKAVTTSMCAGATTALALSSTQDCDAKMTQLAATTTFPAALILFNYLARNSDEHEVSILGKTLASTAIAAGATSLANSARPMVGF